MGAPTLPETVEALTHQVDWEPFVADHPALPSDLFEVSARL